MAAVLTRHNAVGLSTHGAAGRWRSRARWHGGRGGVYGVSGTTAGGRSFADVGRVGGAVGPGGNAAVAGRMSGLFRAHAGRPSEGRAKGSRAAPEARPSRASAAARPSGPVARPWPAGSHGAAAVHPYGDAGAWGWHGGSYAGYHSGWVHGYWGGHYGGWGWGGYGLGMCVGMGMGMAAWGIGSSLYSGWGYMPYANPYYGAGRRGRIIGLQLLAADRHCRVHRRTTR